MRVSDFPEPATRVAARKYEVDERYFDLLNADRAYWLGYLLADGCVALRKRNGRVRQFVLQACSKDKEHLTKLNEALCSTYPLYGPYNGCWQLAIPSYKLCLSLERYGVVPAKSFIAEPPRLPGYLRSHWIRGVIDGDGSFNRYWRPSRATKFNGRGRPATSGRYVLMLSLVGSYPVTGWFALNFGGSHRQRGKVWGWSINDSRAGTLIAAAYAGSRPWNRLDRKFELAVQLGVVTEDALCRSGSGLPSG